MADEVQLQPSSRVRVDGLSGAQHYNGLRGTVLSRSDGDACRYLVQLDGQNKQLRIKETNLELLTAASVHDLSISDLKLLLSETNPHIPVHVTEKRELIALVQTHCSEQQIINFGSTTPSSGSGSGSDEAAQLRAQMKSQRDMLRLNPHMFGQVVAQNPALAGKSYDEVLKHLDMLVEMDPQQLAAMKKMQEKIGSPQNEQAAAQAIGEMDPEQLGAMMRMQRDALKKNPAMFEQVIRQNPQLRGKSYEEVVQHLDMLAEMSPKDLQNMAKMQASMGAGGLQGQPPNAGDAEKIMKEMSPESLAQMMRTQRDMLRANPDMFDQIVAQNPMMRGMSREQVLKQLDTLAEMDPKRLSTMLNAAQKVSAATEPARKAYSELDRITGGKAKALLVFVIGLIICWLCDRYFLS